MTDYYIEKLRSDDGTWDFLEQEWAKQCTEADEDFAEYAPDVLKILKNIAKTPEKNTKITESYVYGLRTAEAKPYLTICMVNRAMIPGQKGYTLRLRHLTVGPSLDFGLEPRDRYADALVWTVLGVIQLANSDLPSQQLRFHLGSPEDTNLFRAFKDGFNMIEGFSSVDIHGSWLYMVK
jgi:hypothetical protein